eukprot:16013-Heterococcus_DN1.PRE.1
MANTNATTGLHTSGRRELFVDGAATREQTVVLPSILEEHLGQAIECCMLDTLKSITIAITV